MNKCQINELLQLFPPPRACFHPEKESLFFQHKPSISSEIPTFTHGANSLIWLHKTPLVGKYAPLSIGEFIAVVFVSCKHFWIIRRCSVFLCDEKLLTQKQHADNAYQNKDKAKGSLSSCATSTNQRSFHLQSLRKTEMSVLELKPPSPECCWYLPALLQFLSTGCYFHVCHLMVKGAEASYKRELQNAVDLSALCYIKACCSIRRCSAIKKYFLNLGASFNADLSRDGGQKCQIYVSFIKRQPLAVVLQGRMVWAVRGCHGQAWLWTMFTHTRGETPVSSHMYPAESLQPFTCTVSCV